MKRETKRKLATYISIGLIIVALEFIGRIGIIGSENYVSLSIYISKLWELLTHGELTSHIKATFYEIFMAFSLSIAVGFPTGLLLWRKPFMYSVASPWLLIFYSIPIFALYPIFVGIFGLGLIPIIIMGFLFSVFALTINVSTGFRQVRNIYKKVGRSFNLSRKQMFFHIYIRAAIPYIFTGLKLGFLYSVIGVIASEFILSEKGLGFLISHSYHYFDLPKMYAVLAFLLLIVIATTLLLLTIENRLYERG